MRKNLKFILIFLVVGFIFISLYVFERNSYFPVENRIGESIENKFEKIERGIKEKEIAGLKKEYWKDNKCVKWEGFTPKIQINKLPSGELFYYENEVAGFFGYREGNIVYYLKIMDLDFFTQQRTNEQLLKNIPYKGIRIDYIKFSDYEYLNFIEKKFKESESFIKKNGKNKKVYYLKLVRNEKGTPIFLLRIDKVNNSEGEKIFLDKLYKIFFFFTF